MDDKYPHVPGFKARQTSEAAANDMKPVAKTLRDQCLALLKQVYPLALSADQVAHRLGKSPLTIRPRITELAKLGLITDSGLVTRNDSGKQAVQWFAKP